jgi:surface carbohydrate biosynthesis protein
MVSIALPIETKVREFYGKLWLGVNLIERGHSVIIGPSYEIHSTLDITEPDVLITKDPGDSHMSYFDKLRSAGISVCGLDTEGGVFSSMDQYSDNKKRVVKHLDALFVWGENQATAVREDYTRDLTNIYVTGNPRFDLLQPEFREFYTEVSDINIKYDNYILLNGNFPFANPYREQVISKVEEIHNGIDDENIRYQSRIFHLFLDMIYELSTEMKDIGVVVRPHPSEDRTTYEREFDRYDNIIVDDSGDVRSWIASANAVIHHDCTTGIESALMGIPVISYRPIKNREYEAELPQYVSINATTSTEIKEMLHEFVKENEEYELSNEQRTHLKQYFENIDGKAAENICDTIDELSHEERKNRELIQPDLFNRLERRIKSSGYKDEFLTIYDGVNQAIGKTEPHERRQYHKRKFPGIKQNEIAEAFSNFQQYTNTAKIEINEIPYTNNTYLMRSETEG